MYRAIAEPLGTCLISLHCLGCYGDLAIPLNHAATSGSDGLKKKKEGIKNAIKMFFCVLLP